MYCNILLVDKSIQILNTKQTFYYSWIK
uniref:Uncharacterized protein n=1 Tax=Anguilla anguilla TaxID=7936 RepID=A0A0E9QPQ4_ANGAN